jgi:hypothetical protein
MITKHQSFALIKQAIDSILISDVQPIIKRYYINKHAKLLNIITPAVEKNATIFIKRQSFPTWECNTCRKIYKGFKYSIAINSFTSYPYHRCWDLSQFLSDLDFKCTMIELFQYLYDLDHIFTHKNKDIHFVYIDDC